jgi:hypothetical protein
MTPVKQKLFYFALCPTQTTPIAFFASPRSHHPTHPAPFFLVR